MALRIMPVAVGAMVMSAAFHFMPVPIGAMCVVMGVTRLHPAPVCVPCKVDVAALPVDSDRADLRLPKRENREPPLGQFVEPLRPVVMRVVLPGRGSVHLHQCRDRYQQQYPDQDRPVTAAATR
ncbi:MAG: hypothetical protein J4F47_03520 [Alphaproteobacteria bacterium]|nr:hypothetical protein [Alphaproteobacteria bacterium]